MRLHEGHPRTKRTFATRSLFPFQNGRIGEKRKRRYIKAITKPDTFQKVWSLEYSDTIMGVDRGEARNGIRIAIPLCDCDFPKWGGDSVVG